MVGRVDSSSFVGLLDRKSSIEKEPRTLNLQQIQFAREAALYVLNTRSMEEALQIFTEGLEPVMNSKERRRQADNQEETHITADEEGESVRDFDYSSAANRCLIRLPSRVRDVYTAPF